MKPDTAIWMADGAEKRAAVQGMFAEIAPTYDRLNGVMTFQRHGAWRRMAVTFLNLAPGDAALDICCGTGDFLIPLRNAVGSTGTVVGLDFCAPMLNLAMDKPADGLSIGDACALPVQSEMFNAVTVGWGIRNVPDIDVAHREAFRVLKHGGRFVSIDMAKPAFGLVRIASDLVSRMLPLLGGLVKAKAAYTYLPRSVDRFMTRDELATSMEAAGFKDVFWRDLFFGNICIHFGRKP